MKNFKTSGPYIKDKNTTNKMMFHLFIALVPIILFSFYKNGIIPYINETANIYELFLPLIILLVSTLTSYLAEYLYFKVIRKLNKEQIKVSLSKSFSIFPGLFLGLILPINTPLEIVILGSLFATVIGKLVYGGFGNNIFNPALIGRLFIVSAYGIVIASSGGYLNNYEVDTISSSTPLSNIVEGIGDYDTLVKPFGELSDFFFGFIPGTLGETSAFLCILAFIYLTIKKVIKPIIPICYVTTVFVMTLIIGLLNDVGIWYPLFQIFSGGLMFGAVFMATDPVTSPTSKFGQVLYGLFLGILTVTFRYLTPYPEGVLTSILTMNMFVVILDKLGSTINFNKNYKKLLLIPVLIIITLPIYISSTLQVEETKDTSYQIISKEVDNNNITYVVTQKGFGGDIKLLLEFNNKSLEYIEVLEHNESYYQKIIAADYINTLMNTNISEVDTVSGATVTSTALKQAIINTYNDLGIEVEKQEEQKEEMTKESIDGGYIYTINTKSFGGDMQVRVTIYSSVVKSVEVISHNDSYFYKIEEVNYLNNYINAPEVDNIDAVTGATVTSNAINNAAIKALEDYRS